LFRFLNSSVNSRTSETSTSFSVKTPVCVEMCRSIACGIVFP